MANVVLPPQNDRVAATLDVYGSSLARFGTQYLTKVSNRWSTKVAAGLGNAFERNWGVGGTTLMSDSATQGWPLALNHAYTQLPNTLPDKDNQKPWRQVATLLHGVNDGINAGSDPNFRETWKACQRAWTDLMRADFYYDAQQAKFSYSASWSNAAANTSWGNVPFKTRGASSGTITFNYADTNWPGGYVDFYFKIRASNASQCAVDLSIGGVSIGTLDATSLGVITWYTLVRARGFVPAGNNNVLATVSSVGAGGVAFMGASMELSNETPLCVVVGTNATPQMPWSGSSDFTTTVKNNLNTDMQTVVAEYDRCVFVPVADVLELNGNGLGDPLLHVDDIHWNETGNDVVARRWLSTVRSYGIPQGALLSSGSRAWAGVPPWSGPDGQVVLNTTDSRLYTATVNIGLGPGSTWAVVNPNRQQILQTARGWKGETPSLLASCTSATTVTSQQILGGAVGLTTGDVVSTLWTCVSVAGAGSTPTTIKLALVDTAGVIKAVTANLTADVKWNTTGPQDFSVITPFTVLTEGIYYLMLLEDGAFTTPLQLARANNAAGTDKAGTGGVAAIVSGGTGKTDITGTITITAGGSGVAFWMAWS